MSSLIVLTDDESSPAPDVPLAGRVLMLNTANAPRFQCFNFVVTRNKPIEIVHRSSPEDRLRQAIKDKILIDITGQEESAGAVGGIIKSLNDAVKSKTMSLVQEGEEIGPRVIMGTDAQGNSYVITPKDEADYQRMQEEIRTTGTLRVEKPRPKAPNATQFSGLSPIYMEDLPEAPPPGE